MKCLVFNLLVVGALAFLLFDGTPPASVRDAVDKAAAKAGQLVEKGTVLVGKPAQRPEAKPIPAPKSKPVAETPAEDTGDDKSVTTVTKAPVQPPVFKTPPQTPRPAKPATVAAAPAPKLSPAVARRRAEVLGEAPDSAAKPTHTTPAFMAPRTRRAELQRLAEDMELLFVDKAVR